MLLEIYELFFRIVYSYQILLIKIHLLIQTFLQLLLLSSKEF